MQFVLRQARLCRRGRTALLLVAAVGLFGCAGGETLDFDDPTNAPPGPGLFSGKDGEFVILGRSKSETEERTDPRPTDSPGGSVSGATTPDNRMPVAAPTIQRGARTPYGVHFASYENAELAQRGWSQIWSKHWRMLSAVQPYIDYGSFGGSQSRYHLFGKGLTKKQAEDLCWGLQLSNEYCAVVNF